MFKKLFDPSKRARKPLERFAEDVMALKETYAAMSDDELKAQTTRFKERLTSGETLDDLEREVYAVACEAATRVTEMTPFKVQIMGAKVLHGGNIAEMKTGEGKTLTAVMPAYLNALKGEGVHIVTVNDYLARREAEGEIGDIFKFLGLTVGLNNRDLSKEEKREAYLCDILYSTNNEIGFDYLRDHMVIYKEDMVQRELSYAIIDEVDSILVDEARTPLIISGGAKQTANLYLQAQAYARGLEDEDYEIDIKTKTVNLTPSGIAKAERHFSIENLYEVDHVGLLHHLNNAIKANYTMQLDVDYVVQDNTVIIVDPFTGRLMHGRQFSEGLHQALEAKEGVEIKKETTTLATITFQNFFRMYKKLAGMTGTAKTEEEEFRNIYNMLVYEIPTNEPVIRVDANDMIFATMQAKYNAIAEEIKIRHQKGQPILVGTISIESSELLASLLKRRGVKHDVLNAKQHEREAEIVENAGKKYSVTIATNMAGRGTDIKLGPGVVELGGLAVIGTERHEARRIDNQLRGRSGRQGDPGYSKFFLSAEDDLMRRFGGDRFKRRLEMVTRVRGKEGEEQPIDFKFFSGFIRRAQRQIEGNNFDRRKTVLQYDEVLRKQREIIYKQRRDILLLEKIDPIVEGMILRHVDRTISQHTNYEKKVPTVNKVELFNSLNGRLFNPGVVGKTEIPDNFDATYDYIERLVKNDLQDKRSKFGDDKYNEFLKAVLLRVVDTYWVQHIDQMSELRQSIGLRSYAQQNPLREYQEIGYQMFEDMIVSIESDTTRYVLRAVLKQKVERVQVAKPTRTSSGKEETEKRQPKRSQKVGRNEPCPCGSGKKYKHCHGR